MTTLTIVILLAGVLGALTKEKGIRLLLVIAGLAIVVAIAFALEVR